MLDFMLGEKEMKDTVSALKELKFKTNTPWMLAEARTNEEHLVV